MDISEIAKKRILAEQEILKILKDFEQETGLSVTYVALDFHNIGDISNKQKRIVADVSLGVELF